MRNVSYRQEVQEKNQVKSNFYYIFWGVMAVAVVAGQIYVGLGYREMANATKSASISVSCIK